MTGNSSPNRLLAGVAACLPLLGTAVCCIGLPAAAGHGDPGRGLQALAEGGAWFFGILATAILAAIAAGVLVFLAGLGRRVPSAIVLLFGILPWLCAVAAHRYGVSRVVEALGYASPSDRAALMARGISEASIGLVFGVGLSAALLGGIGVGLSLAALGQRAPERSAVAGALIGGAAAVPVFGALGHALIGAGPVAGMLLLPCLALLVAAVLGGVAVGKDEPHRRSGALCVAGAAAAGLAFGAASVTAASGALIQIFGAIANVDPSMRVELLARGVAELDALMGLKDFGALLGLLPAGALGVWSSLRVRPPLGQVVGAGAVLLMLALAPLLGVFADAAARSSFEAASSPPWAGVDGFVPLRVEDHNGESPTDPHALITPERAIPWQGAAVPLAAVGADAGRAALAASFRVLLAGPPPGFPDDRDGEHVPMPDWLEPGGLEQDQREVEPSPELVLAFDERVPVDTFRAVLAAAIDGGARSVRVVGVGGYGALSPELAATVRDRAPLFIPFLENRSATTFLLEGALSAGYVGRDRVLLRGTIGAAPAVRIEPHSDSGISAFTLTAGSAIFFPPPGFADAPEPVVLYLALGPDATPENVLRIMGAASAARMRPVLILGQLPAGPEQEGGIPGLLELEGALGPGGLEEVFGVGHADGFGSLGSDLARRPEVESGSATVRGSLSREVIRRVVRRHTNEVRYCYEHELARRPELAGRLVVSIIISPTGAVSGATVESSTLGDLPAEACILASIRRWRFPAPEGGGIVIVQYPFILRSAP